MFDFFVNLAKLIGTLSWLSFFGLFFFVGGLAISCFIHEWQAAGNVLQAFLILGRMYACIFLGLFLANCTLRLLGLLKRS